MNKRIQPAGKKHTFILKTRQGERVVTVHSGLDANNLPNNPGMQALVGAVRSSPDFSAAAVAERLAALADSKKAATA
jgi:hypothetical protein